MKKKIVLLSMVILLPFVLWAQRLTLQGQVKDAISGEPLAGASVYLKEFGLNTRSNAQGEFLFSGLKEGRYDLQVSFVGYQTQQEEVWISGTKKVSISLFPSSLLADEVMVCTTRATDKSATTFKNLSKEELEKNNFGQDLPYLINQTPSVVVASDAGAGVGYTTFRIRGSDPTRTNITINGIPYNDPESHGSFLVNLPDFASSVNNIQIQRGVGTSTNGAGAFGASLNIQTAELRDSAFAELNNSAGSFGTIKNTLKLGTGLIDGKWSIDGRLSRIISDGFIDRASSDLKSFYISGAYYGDGSILRANVFSGKEKTYQAWMGVPEAKLKGDQDALLTHYYNNMGSAYVTKEDSLNLFNANPRKYNSYLYPNQTDNYQQDHYQLLYSKQVNDKLNVNGALHYTRGRGYYEEFKYGQEFQEYGLDSLFIGGDTIAHTHLIRQRWLDNHFYGLTYGANYKALDNLDLTLGGAYNEYRGKHFGEVVWAQYASQSDNRFRYYDNDATKKDFNIFGKAAWLIAGRLNVYADLQYRRIDYAFLGYNNAGANVQQDAMLNFFNPKLGVTYSLNQNSNVYLSWSVAHKEPNRDDYTESTPESRPQPERLDNIELGYRTRSGRFNGGLNFYGMFYRDQLVLTGQINDVGAYIRSNVDKSYRIGAEADAQYQISQNLVWSVTGALSQNRIRHFSEFFDDYDQGGQIQNAYDDTTIGFSPSFVGSSEISWRPVRAAELALLSKYVSRQFLDNTGNSARQLDAFFVNDIRGSYNFRIRKLKTFKLGLQVNNLLNEKYESNGYTWGYVYGGQLITENYYYPQAGTNFMLSLSVGI